ncbi:NADH dehydrogenase [Bacillus cereus]|nr:NADH dehydrogenase [Bacillus cereus]
MELDRFKAEAARSESQGDGAPDSEALFASNEGAKRPEILAAGAG